MKASLGSNKPDFPKEKLTDTLESVKALLLKESEASLGTLEKSSPFVSLTAYLVEAEKGEGLGSLYLLLSDLARHTKNLHENGSVSLLVTQTKPEVPVLERERVTILGEIETVEEGGEKKRLREKYLKRFPWGAMLLALPDFRFYRIRPREVHWIGGFGRVRSWKLAS